MIEVKNDVIKKFVYKDIVNNAKYNIYVMEKEDCYECYIQNDEYGIMDLMFGLLREEYSLEEVIDVIKDNLLLSIISYKSNIEDGV